MLATTGTFRHHRTGNKQTERTRLRSQSASISALIWSVADLLRGDYKPADYGKVILSFTVLRRIDCVLAPTKPAVLEEKAKREAAGVNPQPFLEGVTGLRFLDISPLDLKQLMTHKEFVDVPYSRSD